MHVSWVKSDFDSFRPKIFIIACVLWLGWQGYESWTAQKWVNNATDSANITTSHMAITVFDAICLTTSDTKHLYHAYSGCIRFKLLCPQASEFKPDTSLVDVIQLLYTFIYSAHLLKGQLKQQYHKCNNLLHTWVHTIICTWKHLHNQSPSHPSSKDMSE